MRAAIKLIMIVIGLALLGIAVGVVLLRTQVERLSIGRLEQRLGYAMNTDVRMERIRLLPLERAVVLQNVEVNNPPEFKSGTAIRCERVLMRPDLRTIFSPTVVFDQIVVEGAEVELRYNVGEGTNLGMLAQQAMRLAETHPQGRLVAVKEFSCKNSSMRLSANVVPIPISMEIAPFKLKEVREDKPVSAAKLSAVFLRSLLMETVTLKGLLRPIVDQLTADAKTMPAE